jgi:hypothetical protein
MTDENPRVRKYIEKRYYVTICRTICGNDEKLSGFILDMSGNFLLLQTTLAFKFDGYSIIELEKDDIVRHSSYDRAVEKIFRSEQILGTSYGF